MDGYFRPARRSTGSRVVLFSVAFAAVLAVMPGAARAQRTPRGVPAATAVRRPQPNDFRIGAQLDLGLPDLAGASLVIRPLHWLRLHGGATTSFVGFGLRGGVTLVPFHTIFAPSLTLEGGHVFDTNANKLTERFGLTSEALERVSYSYGNAHLGFELGSPDFCVFYLHGGVSVIRSTLKNTQQLMQEETGDPTLTFSDPKALALVPTAKIGVLFYL